MRTANLAIVFTDIKGFTERTSHQTLEENEQLLKAHNELLAPLFKGLGGRVVKTIGDAFMVTFESPTHAVLSGLAVQDALWKYNLDASAETQLHVRVAINVGEVRLDGNDVFGEPVNIAARVEGLAEAGEVTFTEAVYLSMNRADVAAEELGHFELKGIPAPVRLFRAARVTKEAGEPPFGNKGLVRVGEGSGTQKALMVASTALQSTSRVASAMAAGAFDGASRLVEVAKKPGFPRKQVAAGAAIVVVLVLGALLFGGRNPVEKAIDEAANAKSGERRAKADAAKRLINAGKDPALRSYYLGLLSEGLGETAALAHFKAAAKSGFSGAEPRIIALLSHHKCPLRAAAADAVADLQLRSARGRLEELAAKGGTGDGEQVLVFGCNSKQAAASALKRLKD